MQGWLEMAGPDPSVDPRLVGRMLAELHACGDATTEEVDPWYTETVGAARWQEYVDALTPGYPEIAERLAAVVPELVAFEALVVGPEDLRTCHRDLWADNVRMTPSGRLCVFDWDNCGSADVNHELAMVAWEFGLDDAGRIRALLDAYVEAGGPGRVTAPGDFTMVIAQFGHFYEMAAAPFIDPTATDADRGARGGALRGVRLPAADDGCDRSDHRRWFSVSVASLTTSRSATRHTTSPSADRPIQDG